MNFKSIVERLISISTTQKHQTFLQKSTRHQPLLKRPFESHASSFAPVVLISKPHIPLSIKRSILIFLYIHLPRKFSHIFHQTVHINYIILNGPLINSPTKNCTHSPVLFIHQLTSSIIRISLPILTFNYIHYSLFQQFLQSLHFLESFHQKIINPYTFSWTISLNNTTPLYFLGAFSPKKNTPFTFS